MSHLVVIIQDVAFSDWLWLLSNICLSFLHVFSWLDSTFLFSVSLSPFHNLMYYSLVERHLDWFQVLAIMNCCCCCEDTLVVSDSMRPHKRQPTRLPRPWDSPGKNTGVDCHFLLQCMKVKSESEVAQSCLTLSDPMDYSLPGSSVHRIFQARVLEWGDIAFSKLWTKLQ